MRIEWAEAAIRQYHEIAASIGDDSVDNALLVMARIAETAELLAQTPNIGRVGRIAGTRELSVSQTGFILTYRVRKDTVLIVSIQRAAKSWPRSFHA